MFYSHQLLARKAPMGQIWRAATLHAKINRRKLNKINLVQICEEILNPSVPMALRLSGILMGGVVIVYEGKVKLLYDDVNRLLVELNRVWKVKTAPDRTVLPKGKTQAKYEAVTLPEISETDIGEMEQPLNFSEAAATMRFQQTEYFTMRLDDVDINGYTREEDDVTQHLHQADPADITIDERFDSCQAGANFYKQFERFGTQGDDEVHVNLTSGDHAQFPDTLVTSPPGQDGPRKADDFQHWSPQPQVNQKSDESKETNRPFQDHQNQWPKRRITRKRARIFMDYEQIIIPGHIYQSWLQDATDIVSRRGRNRKRMKIMSTMKMADLMDLPPTVLAFELLGNGKKEIHYPAPLLEQWLRSIQPPVDSFFERASTPQPPEPSSSSPTRRMYHRDLGDFRYEDFNNGFGPEFAPPMETQRLHTGIVKEIPTEILDELRTNLGKIGVKRTDINEKITPGSSVEFASNEDRSNPSSASGHFFPSHNSDSKKRAHSSSRHSGNNLETVAEETWEERPYQPFKLARLSENGLTPEHEVLVETGPTQTPFPVVNQPIDKITDSIRMQLKAHFDSPLAPKVESLDMLSSGMNRRRAALLFYQTCVLASGDFLRLEQKVPYGDIIMSRGAKM